MLEQLVERGGYLALFIGTLIEGETVLLAAGALAHRGLLSFPWVIATALVGGLCSDLLWYSIGRRFGGAFIQKRARLARHAATVKLWMHRAGLLFVLGFHFLYGLRTITPLVLGASRYSARRFLILDLFGVIAWALSVGGAGYGFGASLHALIGRKTEPEEALVVGLIVAIIIGVLTHRHIAARRRAAAETQSSKTHATLAERVRDAHALCIVCCTRGCGTPLSKQPAPTEHHDSTGDQVIDRPPSSVEQQRD